MKRKRFKKLMRAWATRRGYTGHHVREEVDFYLRNIPKSSTPYSETWDFMLDFCNDCTRVGIRGVKR